MRVAVVGATGNIGTSLLRALDRDDRFDSVVAIARRRGTLPLEKVEWRQADIVEDDLTDVLARVDAVVHLAFVIQPMRDERAMRRINIDGSRRVLEAAGAAGVPTFLFASSSGAYAAAPKTRRVDESWPLGPPGRSPYARQKVEVEELLDRFETTRPRTRVVRLRIAVAWKREAATQSRRIFGGPFVVGQLLRPELLPLFPDIPKLRFQCVHSDDVADAIRLALKSDAAGAFNIASDPPLDPRELARIFGARLVPVPAGTERALRGLLAMLWRLRLQPLAPSWLDMVTGLPILDCTRARDVLGWEPRHAPEDVVLELIEGIRDGADGPTPPLAATTSGPGRTHELATGVGGAEP